MRRRLALVGLAIVAFGLAAHPRILAGRGESRVYGTAPRDDAGAATAFVAMTKVLRNPRCMNCHSKGDFPRQGNDEHRHTMNVRRGPEGDGIAGVKCSTCHQDHNSVGLHTPPGAPDWHLPSPQMPMIWEGLSD